MSNNVIMFRSVLSDAVVGDWYKDWWCDIRPDKEPEAHTLEGLREWLKDHGFDLSALHQTAWNSHIWDYGQRQQYWVPTPEEAAKDRDFVAVCIDATGLSWLKEGEVFDVIAIDREMLTILYKGEEREVFTDRFTVGERKEEQKW